MPANSKRNLTKQLQNIEQAHHKNVIMASAYFPGHLGYSSTEPSRIVVTILSTAYHNLTLKIRSNSNLQQPCPLRTWVIMEHVFLDKAHARTASPVHLHTCIHIVVGLSPSPPQICTQFSWAPTKILCNLAWYIIMTPSILWMQQYA